MTHTVEGWAVQQFANEEWSFALDDRCVTVYTSIASVETAKHLLHDTKPVRIVRVRQTTEVIDE
jgi:hypothetical protein